MPQDRRRSTASQPLWTPLPEMFSLEALASSEGLESASLYLQTACYTSGNPNFFVNSATTYLLTLEPCVFPLLLSSDAVLNQQFLDSLCLTFPTNAKDFMESATRKLLDQLNFFYISLPPEEDDSNTSQLHFRLHQTEPALSILSQSTFNSKSGTGLEPRSPTSPSVEDEDIPFLVKKQQKKKVRTTSVVVDDSAFQKIGVRRPRGIEDAAILEADLLGERKEVLKAYVGTLLQSASHKHAQKLLNSKLAPGMPDLLNHRTSSSANDRNVATVHLTQPQSPRRLDAVPEKPVKVIQILEEDVKDFGSWKVLLSGESVRHLRQIRRSDRHMFEIVKKKIQELSIGFFSKSNQKRLIGNDNEVPIYEAKMTGDTRLVYTIDCVPEANGERVTQAIKMFGVYTHAQINSRLWAAVAHWSSKRGSEYRRRCVAREESKQQKGYAFPISWPPMPETYEPPETGSITDVELSLELHALLTHEKFIPLTQSVLDSIVADEESTHPFSVSHREHEIIYHPSSCFVVGRSGTGKTTTMLFKMLGIEKTMRKLGGAKVRQVFVTQSRVLAERVEEYFNNLIQSCATESQTTEELEWRASKRKEIEKNLMELDEEDDNSNLPARLSELEDHHFPLFLTFDKLCKLLEAEFSTTTSHGNITMAMRVGRRFRLADAPDVDFTLEDIPVEPGLQRLSSTSDRKILYDDFRAKYWPHFPQGSVKGLDPALVWNEFLGVIRGSELSLEKPGGSLDRESYENLSSRTQATFARHRSRLYDVFEVYVKLKLQQQQSDSADRTHALLQCLNGKSPFTMFDYIYVDEVQDNLLIDAKLLRSLCRNPHGLFWAGDTAQQITSTAFRFSDLKSFLHRVEEADPVVQAQKRVAVHPTSFTLAINYRSHGGIINCAHSVVQLLMELWPDSIDALDREQGLVDGPKPVFFSGWDGESAHYEQFLFGEANHRIEFGAQQCILVRNDSARERLRQQIGDVGVIMTLYESKGLEFSDVLLYNFFEDSPINSEWRVVLNGIDESKRVGVSVPAFNELRHIGVCSELKFLYVGLTRARNNLWIWDASPWAEPMKQFWESRGQIDIKRPGDNVPRIAVASTIKEWEKMGRILFTRGNYQQAVICFDRAELPLLRDISRSYHLRKLARLLEVGSTQRKAAFSDAADLFSRCAAGDHDQSQKCYIRAGECYAEAGRDREASDAFCNAKEFTKGALHARKAADFDRAADIVRTHRVDASVKDAITSVCRVYFLRHEKFGKARLLFDSDEDFLEHFDSLGFDKSPILTDLGRYEEAADLQMQNGKTIDAIKLYLRASSEPSLTKARDALREELSDTLPIGAVIEGASSLVIENLLCLCDQAETPLPGWKEEISLFRSVIKKDIPEVLASSQWLLENGNVRAALQGFFHGLRQPQEIRKFDTNEMHIHLRRLYLFGARLRSILAMVKSDFTVSINTQKLLGYKIPDKETSPEAILLRSSGINHRVLSSATKRLVHRKTETGELVISVKDAGGFGADLLTEEFRRIIERHSTAAQRAKTFQTICMLNIAGKCHHQDDCKYLHAHADEMKEVTNQRFVLFLHQITVINNMDFLLPKSGKHQLRRIWISQFLDVLYPQTNIAGKLADIHMLHPQQQDGLVKQGLLVLRGWIRDGFSELIPSYTNQMLELFLIATAIDHDGVPQYFRQVYPGIRRRLMSDAFRVNKTERQPLVLDLYKALFEHTEGAMESGVEYILHMITAKAHLDVHLLICVLEITTTRLLAGLKPDLHGLIMPISWLFTLVQHQTWPSTSINAFLLPLLKPLMALAHDIENGCDHLSIEGRRIRDVTPIKRVLLIKRIFRCVVLVGCNFENIGVRENIGRTITSLKIQNTDTVLPINYVMAKTWDALAKAASQPTNTDTVVQFKKAGDRDPPPAPSEVGQHIFQDIPALFLTYVTSPLVNVTQKSTLRASAKPFIPQILRFLGLKTEPDVADGNGLPSVDDPFTQREHEAALLIQKVYRQFRRRAAHSGNGALQYWFNECRKAKTSLPSPFCYHMMLLGPLPHLLVCVDVYRKHQEEQKRRASEAVRKVDQFRLENEIIRLDAIMGARRKFFRIFHDLKPSSAVHTNGDLRRLRRNVEAMCSHIETFCMERYELAKDYRLAYDGIVKIPQKKIIVAPPKPSLNTSDLME